MGVVLHGRARREGLGKGLRRKAVVGWIRLFVGELPSAGSRNRHVAQMLPCEVEKNTSTTRELTYADFRTAPSPDESYPYGHCRACRDVHAYAVARKAVPLMEASSQWKRFPPQGVIRGALGDGGSGRLAREGFVSRRG